MGNFTIYEKAKRYYWKGDSCLSIKTFSGGYAQYQIGDRVYKLNDEKYLLLNRHTNYQLTIDNPTPVTSFCVFFDPFFVAENLGLELASATKQLDGFDIKPLNLDWIERSYHANDRLGQLIRQYKFDIDKQDDFLNEEYYQLLFSAMVAKNHESIKQSSTLEYVKHSTRVEIYKRIGFGKDYIDACFREELTLTKISSIAMMSPNQFLKNFKRMFYQTPFQYVTKLRIKEAIHLLKTTDLSITEIMTIIGYSSLSNFSYYFKSITGNSPSSCRNK